jgi:hypothetical protein
MLDQILNIITLGLKPSYEKHKKFHEIICNFRNKLPRKQNTARLLTVDELAKHPVLSTLPHVTVADISTQKITISESDIDQFYNELNHFDFRFMIFKSYYQEIIDNLNRLNPRAENRSFDLFIVQRVLNDPLHPTKPIDAILYNLKWKYKPTSSIYVWFVNRTKKGRHMR